MTDSLPRTVGLLGGGVIGGGWAARFLLNGCDVKLFDPDPEAPRKMGEILANARRACSKLTMAPLPPEGTLTFVATPEEASTGVEFVQESAPERMELKQALLAAASRAAGPDVVFGSSTSGLLPSELQRDMVHPERLVVGHPFNPVYLMPLVEVCAGSLTSEAACERAAAVYEALGMHPLRVRKEIDGFVADRMMEALWREALWMVNDGVATAPEIDDAIRFGPGIRWSFMGTMLIYRIAGGEAGMRHFMEQFGPSLQWPWTKLMDVPELTDQLLDTLCDQSDDQAAGASIRELEALRDDCLVSVMQSLRVATPGGYGAGQTLDKYERSLFGRAALPSAEMVVNGEPMRIYERTVPTDWVDYNGHVNDARYLQLASEAGDRFLRYIGLDEAYLASGRSWYTIETHVNYIDQAHGGDRVHVDTIILSHDDKRLRMFFEMYREVPGSDRSLVATSEFMLLHVDTVAAKATPMGAEMLEILSRVGKAHRVIDGPPQVGRAVGDPR
jgi:carnitine 3-dehydrogenase